MHTTLRQKWGGGVCSSIPFVLYMHLPPSLVKGRQSGRMAASLKCVLWEISDAVVDTKLRGIEATCIVVLTVNDLA